MDYNASRNYFISVHLKRKVYDVENILHVNLMVTRLNLVALALLDVVMEVFDQNSSKLDLANPVVSFSKTELMDARVKEGLDVLAPGDCQKILS